VIASPQVTFVVLLLRSDCFEPILERRLKQSFGLDPSAGSLSTQAALQLLAEDFAAWVEKTPQEAQEYSVFAEADPAFRICMRCEPFPPLSHPGDRRPSDIESVDPFKPVHRKPGTTG
jgi:hypothetical protein